MIVSWNWLNDHVRLDMPLEELCERLTMAGLNLEGTESVGDDTAIDLEVTSNRPDCLGHIGVAREISVLFDRDLTVSDASPRTIPDPTSSVASVTIDCPELCPRYTARVIRGVEVGPSPDWLVARLATLGIAPINNIVDITNYVLMETGQPLHAFDLDKIREQRIVIRRPAAGEELLAINHIRYPLTTGMCVIADAERPVALGGVMGGLETEIDESTTRVLIEAAEFAPLSIRGTARALSLFSDSSFRFERGVDPQGIDFASRRCCQLILELAGGELYGESIEAGASPETDRPAIELRFAQLARILGIDIPPGRAIEILLALNLVLDGDPGEESARFRPPSWRRDLSREVDLVEEVARIHGYDRIPDDVRIPLTLSRRTRRHRVIDAIRELFCAAGFYEAMTLSFVTEKQFELFRPAGEFPPLRVDHSSRRQENILRQSLVPSLLESRRQNERHGTFGAEMFEVANVYLAADPARPGSEPTRIGCVSSRSFGELKGVVEELAARLHTSGEVTAAPSELPGFVPGRGAELRLDGKPWGWLGELTRDVCDAVDLRDRVTTAELDLGLLLETAELVPAATELARFPAVTRDLNFMLDESVSWDQLSATVRQSAGPLVDTIDFAGQYRGKQIPAGKQSYVVSVAYRSPERTLTNDEVEEAQAAVIAACIETLGAELR